VLLLQANGTEHQVIWAAFELNTFNGTRRRPTVLVHEYNGELQNWWVALVACLLLDLTPERLQKQQARDGYGSAWSGEASRTGKEYYPWM
jgi:hypothetical protein